MPGRRITKNRFGTPAEDLDYNIQVVVDHVFDIMIMKPPEEFKIYNRRGIAELRG